MMLDRLQRATGPALAALIFAMAGCAPDAINDAVDPMATDLTPISSTATMVLGDIEYTYGCPDFPCPVTDLVASHIDGGKWFVMPSPPSTPAPVLYLYVLRVPVKLRVVYRDPDPPPFLKADPGLAGPASMMGTHLAPDQRLACRGVGLEVISPDGRVWEFESGIQKLTFGESPPLGKYLSPSDWGNLGAGSYMVDPGSEKEAYDATFMIRVRGVDGETQMLEHTMQCMDPDPPEPPAPPTRPALEGPGMVRGERQPDLGLVCRNFSLEVLSPDHGPWDFVSGKVVLTYLRWDWEGEAWIKLDRPKTVTPIEPAAWDGLLQGGFTIVPKEHSTAYWAVFEAVVRRVVDGTAWDYPVEERVYCIGPDLWDSLYGAPR